MKNLKKIIFSFGVLLSLVAGLQSASAVGETLSPAVGETLSPNDVRKLAQASWKIGSSDRLALQQALCAVLNKINTTYGCHLPPAVAEIKAEVLIALSEKKLADLERLLLLTSELIDSDVIAERAKTENA